MAIFQISIDDNTQLAGLSYALGVYNAAQNPDAPDYAPLADEAAYVQFVMGKACDSYAKQALTDQTKTAVEAQVAATLEAQGAQVAAKF